MGFLSEASPSAGRPKPLAVMVAVSCLASIFVVTATKAASPALATPVPPNVIIVMTDDQRWDAVTPELMPFVATRLGGQGTRFPNGFVPNPLCCPSRTSTLTGNYSHTTGIYSNGGRHGGFLAFYYTGGDENTIATDFQAAGYRTALVGKYLNGYLPRNARYVPPGWDDWFALPTGAYYDYRAADNGRLTTLYGERPADYSTRVMARRARSFVQTTAAEATPFFLLFAATAPHGPATPDPRDVGRFQEEVAGYAHPPSYKRVTEGQPGYLFEAKTTWQPSIAREVKAFHEHQLESAYGVDRAVRSLLHTVGSSPTIVLFMSDNGMLWGEHYWRSKVVSYEESIRVPMILWSNVPGLIPSTTDPDPILNVDVRPTLEGLVGDGSVVTPGEPTDGVDIFRRSIASRDFPLEQEQIAGVPSYCGVRTTDGWMFTHYATGEEELYHVEDGSGKPIDPYELTNLVADLPGKTDALRDEARALCVTEPPEFSWDAPIGT